MGTGAQSAGISWFSPWDPPDLLGFWLCRGESVRAGDASAFRLGRLHYSSDPKLHCTSCPKCFVRSTVHKHCVALCCIGVLVAHRLDLEQSLPANKKKGWTATANRSPEVGLDRKAKARLCTPHIPILRSRILSDTGQNSKSAFRRLLRTPQSWIRVVASIIILYWARKRDRAVRGLDILLYEVMHHFGPFKSMECCHCHSNGPGHRLTETQLQRRGDRH